MLRRSWIATLSLMCATVFWVRAEDTDSRFPRQQATISTSQQELRSPMDGKLLFGQTPPAQTDCTEAMSNLSLQPLWIQDQPGGDLTTEKPPKSHPATPEQLADDLEHAFPDSVNKAKAKYHVVILVVDDFSTDAATAMHISQDPTNSDHSIHHGALVQNQIDKMITKLDLTGFISTVPVNLYSRTTSTAAQKENTTLESLATRIQKAIREHRNADHFLVNMSYVQMSCRVLDDYKQWRAAQHPGLRLSFREYADAVWEATLKFRMQPSTPTPDWIVGGLMSPDFTKAKNSSFLPGIDLTKVHWVAAAGNYGLHFPLYPAAWPNVIGVSASGENYLDEAIASPTRLNNTRLPVSWSNWGDVTERGQVFKYDRPGSTYPVLYYYGTSFAAPLASVRLALTLMRGSLTLMRGSFDGCPVPDLYPGFPQNGRPFWQVLSKCLK